MRLNIYAEEVTKRLEIVEKHVVGHDKVFYGIRFYLDSSPKLHNTPDDNDQSAVTFWIPDSKTGGNFELMSELFEAASEMLLDKRDEISLQMPVASEREVKSA